MFSVENPPEHSSSRKVLALESDDRAYSLETSSSPSLETPNLGSDLEDDEEQHPNFCLRNYVFASRSKDLSVNWPFPQQFLQLCLKHGVRDPLPPFEPPDSTRTQQIADTVEAHHRLVSSPAVEGAPAAANVAAISSTNPSDSEPDPPVADPRLDPAPDPPRDSSSEEKSAVSSAGKSAAPPPGHDRTRSEVSASGQAEKKTRLVVKSGASDSSRSGEKLPGFSSGSEAMVSKVCPVCRTFSSSSNTTLNAHIDQCLSSESLAGRGMAVPSKHRVKPRKKRSMEEICATAPRCTLEDLDRRNGTNWASELTSAAHISAASRAAESKRPRISPLNSGHDEREGSVYVDSKGTKLLILSKLNDGLPPPPLGAGRSKLKGFSELRDGRGAPPGRRKSFPPKCGKYLKAKGLRKNANYFKRSKVLIHRVSEGKVDAGIHRGDERNDQEQAERVNPGNLGLSKGFNGKISRRKRRNALPPTDSRSTEDDQSISYASREFSVCVRDSSGPSDGSLPAPKTRSIGVLSKKVGLTDTPESSSSSPPPVKIYRSTGDFSPASSGGEVQLSLSKGADRLERNPDSSEIDCGVSPSSGQKPAKSGNFARSSENHHGEVPKSGRCSSRSPSMDGRRSPTTEEEILQRVVSKKLRKGKSAENPHELAEELAVERAEENLRAAVDLQDKVNLRSSEGRKFLVSDNTWLPEADESDAETEVAPNSTLQIRSSLVKVVGSSGDNEEAVASEDLAARSLDNLGASSTGTAKATIDEEEVLPELLGDQGVNQCFRRLDIVKKSTVASDGELPGSPVSSSSTISNLSVEERESSEGHLTELENFKSDFRESALLMGNDDDGVRGPGRANLEKKAPRLKAIPPAQEHEKLWEDQPCRCSRPSLSHRQAWGACSVLDQEAMPIPISDFSTGSVSAMSRTASSPVLRLMGKNLMVMNREEKPVHQHNMASSSSSGEASLLGVPPACSFPNQGEDFWFHHHRRMEGSIFPGRHPSWLPAETMGAGFGGPMLQSGIRARTGLLPRGLIPERQVIVIDDSPHEPGGGRVSSAGAMAGHYYGSDFRRVPPPLPPPPPFFPSQRWLSWRGPGHGAAMAGISSRWGGSLEAYSGPPPQRASVFPSLPADLLAPSFRYLPSVHWTPR